MGNYDEVEIIELKWNCKDCSTQGILGRHKRCPSCGSPRENNEMQMDGLQEGSTAPVVKDKELLELAKAGPDWFCACCGSGNRGDASSCTSCAAPKGSKPAPKPQPKPPPPPPRPVEPQRDPTPEPSRTLPCLALVALCLAALAFIWWAMSSHQVVGNVSGMSWTRVAKVETWTDVVEREWRHKANERREVRPTNGVGESAGYTMVPGSCRDEHYEDEKYQCGTKPEDYDCSYNENYSSTCTETKRVPDGKDCKTLNNGFAECRTKYRSESQEVKCTKQRKVKKTCTREVPKYCTREIYKTKCDYTTQKWKWSRTKSSTGTGTESLTWPNMNITLLERELRESEYKLIFAYTDGEAETAVRTVAESEYLRWHMGQPVYLTVTNLGYIHDYSSKPKE
jgi:hypothetical protein